MIVRLLVGRVVPDEPEGIVAHPTSQLIRHARLIRRIRPTLSKLVLIIYYLKDVGMIPNAQSFFTEVAKYAEPPTIAGSYLEVWRTWCRVWKLEAIGITLFRPASAPRDNRLPTRSR